MRPRRRRLRGNGRAPEPVLPLLAIAGIASAPTALAAGLPAAGLAETCLHVLRLCLAAFAHVDVALHAAPMILVGFGLLRAAHRQHRRFRSGQLLVRLLPSRSPRAGEPLHRLAERHGVAGVVRVTAAPAPNPAFTAGLLRPRIHIAEALQRELTEEELEAVLLHEIHHLRRRDPLRTLVLATLSDALFWLPLVPAAAARALARMEFAADDAARRVGDMVLAGAILRVAELGAEPAGHASAFAAPPLLGRRVERLLGESDAERLPPPPGRALTASVAVLALVWFLGLASSASHAAHTAGGHDLCPHEHESFVLHDSQ